MPRQNLPFAPARLRHAAPLVRGRSHGKQRNKRPFGLLRRRKAAFAAWPSPQKPLAETRVRWQGAHRVVRAAGQGRLLPQRHVTDRVRITVDDHGRSWHDIRGKPGAEHQRACGRRRSEGRHNRQQGTGRGGKGRRNEAVERCEKASVRSKRKRRRAARAGAAPPASYESEHSAQHSYGRSRRLEHCCTGEGGKKGTTQPTK